MLVVALLRIVAAGNRLMTIAAGASVALVGIGLYLSPVLIPLGNLNLLTFFVILVAALVFAAVPIALAFGLATFAYITLTTSTPDTVVIGRMDEGMSHCILLSVPLFVFIGLFAPPFGVGHYPACAISRIHPDEGIRPMLDYILALLIATIIIAAVPWISIGLLG